MMNILKRKGWKLEFSEHANLSQKFEEVSEWLELEDRIEALERDILRFEERRPNEAKMGLEIIENARLNGNSNPIKQLELDVKDEIRDNFPYRYMYVERCEADDIIAVLVKHATEPVLIVSGDKDFQQLHTESVTQWSPNLNRMVHCEDPQTFL